MGDKVQGLVMGLKRHEVLPKKEASAPTKQVRAEGGVRAGEEVQCCSHLEVKL